mmetsp:Transcript_9374/g.17872  ORF Transcript_9374/g.17872 Transcript_9374/m.17872 type:complete len:86 (-) Transcript_9374:371-628(-)
MAFSKLHTRSTRIFLNGTQERNVEDKTAMFRDAVSFNQPLDAWDVSSVKKMSHSNDWETQNITISNTTDGRVPGCLVAPQPSISP